MELYSYICLVGICAFYLYNRGEVFKGSSNNMKALLVVFSAIGFISFFAMIITSFFHFTWWIPILLLVITSILSSFIYSASTLIKSLVLDILAISGIIILNTLVWNSLI